MTACPQHFIFFVTIIITGALCHARLMFDQLNISTSLAQHYSRMLDNQNIIMIGDSLMRYQYLSLVYLVNTESFYPETRKPSILWEKDYDNWNQFYNATNAEFYPNEYCDCYRTTNPMIACENRYYYNSARNISISYIQYLGDNVKIHGHWSPLDNTTNHVYHAPSHGEFIPYRWETKSIRESLTDHVAKLDPKPSVLILNAGFWPNHFAEEEFRTDVLNTALSVFDRVIWKTTNYDRDRRAFPSPGICHGTNLHPGVECLNLDWTEYLHPSEFRDRPHFLPHVYADIDIQLILQLTHRNFTTAFVPFDADYRGQIVHFKDMHYLVDEQGILRPFSPPKKDIAHKQCIERLSGRSHVHLPGSVLRNHILGAVLPDICAALKTPDMLAKKLHSI